MDRRIVPNRLMLEEAARLLEEGREVRFTPRGSSMLPLIRGGRDSVTLKKFPSVTVGDIVLARIGDGHYVLHRVIRAEDGQLVLMGDGNVSGTERCRAEDVLGSVTEIQRGKRTVIPGKGKLWRALKPVRRYILAIYRRVFP